MVVVLCISSSIGVGLGYYYTKEDTSTTRGLTDKRNIQVNGIILLVVMIGVS